MKYRLDKKTGNKLSILGFGCLRFPNSFEKTEKLILQAVESGVNYFDTAYIYSDSEEKLGGVLAKHNLRSKVYLATKMPLSQVKRTEDFDRLFEVQLKRLKTDYVDYYLMHMLTDKAKWDHLCELGIVEWIENKKKSGEIKQIGFSFHGNQHDFLQLLEVYEWEFCLIQYNYADEHAQAGVVGLRRAAELGLTVMIMEPLLGGKLVTGLPKSALKVFKAADDRLSPAAWALNWLWNQPEISVVLSGMNEESQLVDNICTAEVAEPLMITKEQALAYEKVGEIFKSTCRVPCTGCNYCMPCPFGVNIPACFSAYNMSYSMGLFTGVKQYFMSAGLTTKLGTASRCKKCGKCEAACPQKIEIRKNLKKAERRIEPFWCKIAIPVVRRIFKTK